MYVVLYAMYVILYVMYVCSGLLACFYLILFLVKRIEHFNHLDMRYINALYYYYYYNRERKGMIKKGVRIKEDRESKITWRYKTIVKLIFYIYI